MENPIIRHSYGELRKNTEEYYRTIGRIWCPTLNISIVFDKTGFRHLIRQGNSQRPKSEQKRRFALLAQAVKILKSETAYASCRRKENTTFWALDEVNNSSVRVIVRQIDGKEAHFLSVFQVKTKIRPVKSG
jgi:hypothetical protein